MKQTKCTWGTLAASIFVCGLAAIPGHAQTSDALLNKLVSKGILTPAEAEELKKEAATPVEKKPTFVFPLGKETTLKLGGFIQANAEFRDVGAFEGSFNPPGHDRFRIRRGRINVSGDFLEAFDFKAEGDFAFSDGLNSNSGGTRTAFEATDVFINWHRIPQANIKIGQWKAPFGLEQTTSDTTLFTAERSLVTGALTPERQIGVQLWGKPLAGLGGKEKDMVEYYAGAFNGNNRNITVNDDDRFMFAGRVVVTPFTGKVWDQDVKLKLGGNGFYSRYAPGTRLGQSGNLLWNNNGSLSPFNAPTNTESVAWGADASLSFGPFDLIGEYLEERVTPKASGSFSEFIANGYYVQASYFLPGRKFQLVAKWESFNPGQANDDNIHSVTGGLNYYINGDHLKLMFDYIHTWSDYREEHPQFGRDQFDLFLTRVQLMF